MIPETSQPIGIKVNKEKQNYIAIALDLIRKPNFQIKLMITVAILLRLAWIAYTNHTYEDAFITFRYAHQLVEGNGFVYNLGERVYGTTTPLFTILTSIWLLFVRDGLVIGARLLNLGATVGALILLSKTLQKIGSTQTQIILVLFQYVQQFIY